MKKSVRSLFLMVVFGLGCSVLSGCGDAFPNDLTIDGEKISRKEYETAVEQVEYDTEMYIQDNFGEEMSDGFWEKEYDGSEGYEILTERAMERIQNVHAVYDLAYENGDVADKSFDAIQERCAKENERRKKAIEDGQVIYGLKEYTFELYEEYEMGMLKETYCNSLDREGMKLSEDEVKEHYQNNDWLVGGDEQKSSFEKAKIAVERDLREKKYDEMVETRAKDSTICGYDERLVTFTKTVIK